MGGRLVKGGGYEWASRVAEAAAAVEAWAVAAAKCSLGTGPVPVSFALKTDQPFLRISDMGCGSGKRGPCRVVNKSMSGSNSSMTSLRFSRMSLSLAKDGP